MAFGYLLNKSFKSYQKRKDSTDNLFNNCLNDKRKFFRNLNNVTGRTQKHTINKTGTSKVGAKSKAQEAQKIFFQKNF